MDNKWVFKVKPKSDGIVDQFKSRLVAKDYFQTSGIDYGETYAPTAKMEDSIRTILAIAAAEDTDMKTTFLYGELSYKIYMTLLVGYPIPKSSGQVCRLHESLYSLKQANRVWNEKFIGFLKAHDLQQSATNP